MDMFVSQESDFAIEEGVNGVGLAERMGERLRQIHAVVQKHTRRYQARRYGRIERQAGACGRELRAGDTGATVAEPC